MRLTKARHFSLNLTLKSSCKFSFSISFATQIQFSFLRAEYVEQIHPRREVEIVEATRQNPANYDGLQKGRVEF